MEKLVEQRSLDWFRIRLGNFTGSKVGDLMVKGKSKDDVFGKTALSYINQVASERLLSKAVVDDDAFFQQYLDQVTTSTKEMRWGIDQEDACRSLFSKLIGKKIVDASSCKHPVVAHFASSPDGVIADSENSLIAVEIKCPKPSTYVDYLSVNDAKSLKDVNSTYYWQCFAHMACTGADATYFVVYNPFMQTPIHYIKIDRDEDVINSIIERVKLADIEVSKILLANKVQAKGKQN